MKTSKGQAASGEARRISRFFVTLEYREDHSERVPFPKYLRGGDRGDAGPDFREGEGPREDKPRRARTTPREEICTAPSQPSVESGRRETFQSVVGQAL
jgi:hypothetical protein